MANKGDGSIVIDVIADASELEKSLNNLDSVISKGFDVLAKQLEKLTDSFNKTANETEKVKKSTEGVGDTAKKSIDPAAESAKKLGDNMENTTTQTSSLESIMSSLDKTMKRLFTVELVKIVAQLASKLADVGTAAFKVGSDFESAFAGVRKTVDATESEFAALEAGFRDMAKSMPMTAKDIANIGEAAGQLGIQTNNILGFTKVIADLGVATNIVGQDGAAQIAKFANITGMVQTDFDKFGSSIVALGNNFSTTEADILNMSMRLAGAGAQVGMTEAQILGVSTALSSLGIEAEMGGSAYSKLLVNMSAAGASADKLNYVIEQTGMSLRDLQFASEQAGFADLAHNLGMTKDELNGLIDAGTNLENFGKIAGMTGAEFKAAFETDAVGALQAFVGGLGNADEAETSAIAMLEEMGISEVRLRDSLLRAAGAGDLLTDAVNLSTEAWEENVALANEAEQRYATMESKIQVLKNTAADLGISVYESMRNEFAAGIDFGIEKLNELSNAFKTDGFEGLASTIGNVFSDTSAEILNNAPKITEMAGQIIISFVDGLNDNIPQTTDAAMKMGLNITETIAKILPKVAELGLNMGVSFVGGLLNAIPELINQFGLFGNAIAIATAAVVAYNIAMKVMATVTAIQNIIKTVTAAITAFQTAMMMGTGVTEAFTISMLAFNVSLAPIAVTVGIIGAAIGALALACVSFGKTVNENTKDVRAETDALKEYTDGIKAANDAARENAKAHEETISSINTQLSANSNLVEQIYKLADAENKTTEQKAQLIGLVDTLNMSVSGLNLVYNEQKDSINMASEELLGYMSNLAEVARLEENQKRLGANMADKEETQSRYNTLKKDEADILQKIQNIEDNRIEKKSGMRGNYDTAYVTQTRELKEYYTQLENVQSGLQDTKQEMDNLDAETLRLNNSIADGVQKTTEYETVLNEATEALRQSAQAHADAIEPMRDKLINAYNDIEKAERDKLAATENFYNDYVNYASNAFNEVPEAMDISLREMADNLEENAEATKQWADGLATLAQTDIDSGFLETLRGMGPEARDIVAEMVDGIDKETGKLTGTAKEVNDGFTNIGDEAKKALEDSHISDKFDEEITAAMKTITKTIDDPQFQTDLERFQTEVGVVIPQYVKDGIKEGTPEAIAEFISLLNQMIDSAGTIGGNVAAGMAKGIEDGIPQAEEASKKLGTAISNSARQTLEIQSPSKVFERIGQYIPEGMQIGIDEASGKPIAAMEELLKGLDKVTKDELNNLFSDFKTEMSDMKFFDQIDTQGELSKWKEMQALYAEGTKERGEIDKQVYSLQKQLNKQWVDDSKNAARERETAIRETYSNDKQIISDRILFEESSTQQQIDMWEDLKVKYKGNVEYLNEINRQIFNLNKKLREENFSDQKNDISEKVRLEEIGTAEQIKLWEDLLKDYNENSSEYQDIDRTLFDLRRKLSDETYAAEKQSITDAVHYSDMTTAESIAYQISEYEKLSAEYQSNADRMTEINGKLYDLRQQQDKELTSDYITNLDYQLQFTQKSEKEKLQYKMSAITAEIAARKKAGQEYKSLEDEYAKYARSIAKIEYDDEMKILQDMRNEKDRNYKAELEQLNKIINKYKDNALIQEDLAKQVSDYRISLLEKESALQEQYNEALKAQAKSVFDSFNAFDMITVDLPAEFKKIDETAEKNVETGKNMNISQSDYNRNLEKTIGLQEQFNELNDRWNESEEIRREAWNNWSRFQYDPGANKDEKAEAERLYNAAVADQNKIEKDRESVQKELNTTQKETNQNKKDMRESTADLIKQYPELKEWIDKETGALNLTAEALDEVIAKHKELEREQAKNKKKTDFFEGLDTQIKDNNEYIKSMGNLEKKLEQFGYGSEQTAEKTAQALDMIYEQFNQAGVGSLDDLREYMKFTDAEWQQLIDKTITLNDQSGKIAENQLKKTKTDMETQKKTITDTLSSLPGEVKTIGVEAGAAIVTGISEGVANNIQTLTDTLNNVIDQWNPLSAKPLEVGIKVGIFADGESDVSDKANENIKDALANLPEDMKAIGIESADSFVAGMTEESEVKKEELQAAISGDISEVLATAATKAYADSMPIGSGIIEGIIAGFNSLLPTLINTVSAAMTSLSVSAMSALQINSPSRVFRDRVGRNIALGIGVGIDDEMTKVIEDTKRHMHILTKAVEANYRLPVSPGEVMSRANNANMSDIRNMLQVQLDNSANGQKAAQPEVVVRFESAGSERDIIEALGIKIKRYDYLSGKKT